MAGAPPEIASLAAPLVEEVRSIQPSGPYHLGGYSFGGIVALEMARQLCALGEPIGLLALIDCHGPGYPSRVSRAARERRHWQRMWNSRPAARSVTWPTGSASSANGCRVG